MSPAKEISDIREQVGKGFVRRVGDPRALEDELLLPPAPPSQLGLVAPHGIH